MRKTVQQSLEKTKKSADADNKWKTYSVKQAKEIFESMRKELQVTKDNVPLPLKEVFDIFVEIPFFLPAEIGIMWLYKRDG